MKHKRACWYWKIIHAVVVWWSGVPVITLMLIIFLQHHIPMSFILFNHSTLLTFTGGRTIIFWVVCPGEVLFTAISQDLGLEFDLFIHTFYIQVGLMLYSVEEIGLISHSCNSSYKQPQLMPSSGCLPASCPVFLGWTPDPPAIDWFQHNYTHTLTCLWFQSLVPLLHNCSIFLWIYTFLVCEPFILYILIMVLM